MEEQASHVCFFPKPWCYHFNEKKRSRSCKERRGRTMSIPKGGRGDVGGVEKRLKKRIHERGVWVKG